MTNILFPCVYALVVLVLLWQAFQVIRKSYFASSLPSYTDLERTHENSDRTGRLTIHPELLNQEGRITDEELLTVRFSDDLDSPYSAETSAE